MTHMKVTKSQYSGSNCVGDFSWMIDRPEYARSLFIFNDNETQFKAFHANQPAGLSGGGGNAVIRPFQGGAHPHAAGIPTGDGGEGSGPGDAADEAGCGFSLTKIPGGRSFELGEVEAFLRDKKIGPLDGFRSKAGWPFTAEMVIKFDEETKLKKRAIELNNGRAAMMGILGLMVHEKLGGSIPIVGEM